MIPWRLPEVVFSDVGCWLWSCHQECWTEAFITWYTCEDSPCWVCRWCLGSLFGDNDDSNQIAVDMMMDEFLCYFTSCGLVMNSEKLEAIMFCWRRCDKMRTVTVWEFQEAAPPNAWCDSWKWISLSQIHKGQCWEDDVIPRLAESAKHVPYFLTKLLIMRYVDDGGRRWLFATGSGAVK